MANYLGRHVNLALLIIIIGVIVAMVGTTVFFQRSLQNRTEAFEDTTTTLDQCQVSLQNYQEKYSEAQEQVTSTAEDIRKYDQLYEQKVGELGDSQSQLLNAQKQLEFERIQKEKFQDFYEVTLQQKQQLESQIATKDAKISSLENQISNLEDDLEACQG